ncbi:MAG: hypothetical protein HC859_01065, partial [Bacteroidia bacterium]|nr:hypothetical protein [Bacteroidia bacterium]
MVLGAGWAKQLNRQRPYLDLEVERIVANKQGDVFTADARVASYFSSEPEDATASVFLEWFSRLKPIGRWRFRQSLRASYTTHINRTFNDLLELGDRYGVRGFRPDSLAGFQRLGFSAETTFFTKWKLLGFKFAPIVFADLAFLDVGNKGLFYSVPYSGIGAGMRTRNENLTFGTIELRFTYFPKVVED